MMKDLIPIIAFVILGYLCLCEAPKGHDIYKNERKTAMTKQYYEVTVFYRPINQHNKEILEKRSDRVFETFALNELEAIVVCCEYIKAQDAIIESVTVKELARKVE